jgi:DNA-binding IclR family transcriptional regulator
VELGSDHKPYGVVALVRGLEIMRCFSAKEPALSNGQLATYTGLPKSTISRLTATLVDMGYLQHDKKNRYYSVGASVLALGYAALSNIRAIDLARPHMQALANSTGALVSMSTRDRLQMLYVEACYSDASLTLKMGRGVRMPILTTSIGRVFLAALPTLEREYLLSELAADEILDKNSSQAEAAQVEFERFKQLGYCLSIGDWKSEVNAAATPIVWSDSNEILILSISGPSFIVTPERLEKELVAKLMELAEHINSTLNVIPLTR